MRKCVADGIGGDLTEGHPARLVGGHLGCLGDVPGNRFSLAIQVGRQVHRIRGPGLAGDRLELFAAIFADHVFGLEIVLYVDTQLVLAGVLGQVADVAVRRQDPVAGPQVSLDRPRLGR